MARPPGRKPLPSYLKVVKGTARKSRENKAEAKLDLARPMPPPELSDDAKVEWGRVSDILYKTGILTEIDRGILAAYCQSYGRWMQAERTLAKMAKMDEGTGALMLKTQAGNTIQNPLVGIANKAMADMARYATDLGMTPSARSRVQAKPREEDDPAAKYGA